MSLPAASLDRTDWENFLSADSVERKLLVERANDLQRRIDTLSKKMSELHRDMDRTHNRIECASKVMQVMAVVAVQFLGIVAIDYVFKRHKRAKRIEKIQKAFQHLDNARQEKA
jgi:hypothetical protein